MILFVHDALVLKDINSFNKYIKIKENESILNSWVQVLLNTIESDITREKKKKRQQTRNKDIREPQSSPIEITANHKQRTQKAPLQPSRNYHKTNYLQN